NGFQGTVVSPFFDSLLVKACVHAPDFAQANKKMVRALTEFRIRGVKTNIPFLKNVIMHPEFVSGDAKTTFIDGTPELFEFPETLNRGNKMLAYLGNITVNGFPGIERNTKKFYEMPRIPQGLQVPEKEIVTAKMILDKQGPEAVSQWVREQNNVLLTDTTFRDAHQSLLATRVRTNDLLKIAEATQAGMPQLFSNEL